MTSQADPVDRWEAGRTVEAVVFTWEGAAGEGATRTGMAPAGRRPAMPPLRRRIERLSAAGVDVAIVSRAGVALVEGRLQPLKQGPGRILLTSARGDKAMRDILAAEKDRGIGPGLILVVGAGFAPGGAGTGDPGDRRLLIPEAARAIVVSVNDEPAALPPGLTCLGGGRPGLLRLLDEQLRRRAHGRVPAVDEDPAWVITDQGTDPRRYRVTESLFTIGSGGVGTRGAVEDPVPGRTPLVLAAGIYEGTGHGQHLLPGPQWTALRAAPAPATVSRILDLRTGVLARTEDDSPAGPLRSFRFASAATPGVMAMRAEAPAARLHTPGPPLQAPRGRAVTRQPDGTVWAQADGAGGGIGALAAQRAGHDAGVRTVQRMAAYVARRNGRPQPGMAVGALRAAEDAGFDRLLAQHRAAWAQRWGEADVQIPDDPDTQLAVRFALFQLWSSTGARDELAVGARGLSGTGYAGHVFWDADVFVLPALVTICPDAAAAMVRYRLRRLPAARARARAHGRRGARFPWESAAGGEDVTPTRGMLGGNRMPIRTGELEEHVTADVAWAAVRCAEWTGERGLPGLPLLLETARYWASRCRLDAAGAAHIDSVIGPDEYHERVDDNAFTNVMARWNLRAAADAADLMPHATAERMWWRQLAGRIVDGYDPATGRYEQFAGYFGLKPLLVADFAEPPIAADLLLGRQAVADSQVIKQPDVLMLHHLVPGEVAPGSLAPNLDFYDPRTSHGSSLSPSVTASLLARAGRPDDALAMLRIALNIDLSDLTGTTAAGLHMANLGGVWQAMLTGFAGVRIQNGALLVDPRLPAAWGSLRLRFHCLGRRVALDLTRERTEITTDAPLLAALAGEEPRRVAGRCVLGRPGRAG